MRREGCYRDALCVDTMGGVWPIVEARLKQNPSLLDRLLPSTWVAIELELGPRRNASPGEVAAWLTDVLRNSPGFSEHLTTSLGALRRRFEAAGGTEDLIRIAGEVSRDRR